MGAGRVLGAITERRRASPPSPVEVRLSSDGGCDGGPAAAMGASPAAPPLRILGPAVEQNGAVGFFNDGSPMSQPWMLPQCSDPTTWYTQFWFNIARSSILPNIAHRNHYRTANKIYECSEVGTTLNFSDTVLIATYSGIRSAFLHSTLLTILHSQS